MQCLMYAMLRGPVVGRVSYSLHGHRELCRAVQRVALPCLLYAAQSVCRVVGVRCLKSGRLGAALQWALKAKVNQSRSTPLCVISPVCVMGRECACVHGMGVCVECVCMCACVCLCMCAWDGCVHEKSKVCHVQCPSPTALSRPQSVMVSLISYQCAARKRLHSTKYPTICGSWSLCCV